MHLIVIILFIRKGWNKSYQGETVCGWHRKFVLTLTGDPPCFCGLRVCISFHLHNHFVIILLKQSKMQCGCGLPHVKTLSLSVAFTQWSHFVLSDLGYRRARRCAVAHEETESCGCTDLRLWWKWLERKAGTCHVSGHLCRHWSPNCRLWGLHCICGQMVIECKWTNECLWLLQNFEQRSKTGWVGHVSFHKVIQCI